jgi:hypothetical protein
MASIVKEDLSKLSHNGVGIGFNLTFRGASSGLTSYQSAERYLAMPKQKLQPCFFFQSHVDVVGGFLPIEAQIRNC